MAGQITFTSVLTQFDKGKVPCNSFCVKNSIKSAEKGPSGVSFCLEY